MESSTVAHFAHVVPSERRPGSAVGPALHHKLGACARASAGSDARILQSSGSVRILPTTDEGGAWGLGLAPGKGKRDLEWKRAGKSSVVFPPVDRPPRNSGSGTRVLTRITIGNDSDILIHCLPRQPSLVQGRCNRLISANKYQLRLSVLDR